MASKKGIAITIIILGAITGASFLVWMVPQQNETTVSFCFKKVEIKKVINSMDLAKEFFALTRKYIN